MISSAAIIIGCVLGIVAAIYHFKEGGLPTLSAQLAASRGTTIQPVSIIPAKGSLSTRRRLVSRSSLRRSLASAISPELFARTCDYNLAGEPDYTVEDSSASDSINIINQISCFINQLRISDVGLNTTFNPGNLPYSAMVDEKLCGGQGVTVWYVTSTKGPEPFGSDGIYTANMIFLNEGSDMHLMLQNTISGGLLATSNVYFESTGRMHGLLLLDQHKPETTTVLFGMTCLAGMCGPQAAVVYLNAAFNPLTFEGSAVSSSFDGTAYALDFNTNAINRRKSSSSGPSPSPPVTTCVDFSLHARMLVGDRYTLYSAEDGSKVAFSSGFPIQHKFAQFDAVVRGYAGFGGIWTDSALDSEGQFVSTKALFTDGLVVSKMNYGTSASEPKTTDLTLKLAPARLQRVTRRESTLADLQGLRLTVQSWQSGSAPFSILWDGTQLLKVSIVRSGCMNHNGNFAALAEGVSVNTWEDCLCLNSTATNGATVRSSGAFDYNSYWYNSKGEAELSPHEQFHPQTGAFPQGIQVSTKSGVLNGLIQLEYESLQQLYGMKEALYIEGQEIVQPSSGAVGRVYETSRAQLYGVTCSNCVSSVQVGHSDCTREYVPENGGGGSKSCLPQGVLICQTQFSGLAAALSLGSNLLFFGSSPTGVAVGMKVSGPGIPAHTIVVAVEVLIVTLNHAPTVASEETYTFSVCGQVAEQWCSNGNNGLGFDYVSASAGTFDTSSGEGLELSLPADLTALQSLSNFKSLSGVLTWDSNSGLSTDYGAVAINSTGAGCSTSFSGSVSENNLIVTGLWAGVLRDGMAIRDHNYPPLIRPGTVITAQVGGTAGGVGSYLLSATYPNGFLDNVGMSGGPNVEIEGVSNATIGLYSWSGALDYAYIDAPMYFSQIQSPAAADVNITLVDVSSLRVGMVVSSWNWQDTIPANTVIAHVFSSLNVIQVSNPVTIANGGVSFQDKTNAGSGCSASTLAATLTGCVVNPTITLKCARRIVSEATSVKIVLPTADAAKFVTTNSMAGYVPGDHAVLIGGQNVGTPYWSNAQSGNIVPITGETKVIYRTDEVVMPGDVVPPLLCSSGASQCPRAASLDECSGNECNYDRPSHLSPRIDKTDSGKCYPSAVSGALVHAFSFIEGLPQVGVDWSAGQSDENGDTWHRVDFLRLTDRGHSCDSSNTPTVIFSGPTVVARFTTASLLITFEPVLGLLANGMLLEGDGIAANTTIVCPGSGDALNLLFASGGTCSLSKRPLWNATAAALEGLACDQYPTATLSCDSSGNDLADFRQALSYTFDSASGILTDLTPVTGGLVYLRTNATTGQPINPNYQSEYDQLNFGVLFENSLSNKAKLLCDWDLAEACAWKVWQQLDEFFYYNTGPGATRVSMLQENGAPVVFDQPLPLLYTHSGSTSNSGKDYDGVKMLLMYNGPGDLQGFPQVCLDGDLLPADCVEWGSSQTSNFPDITISPAVVLADQSGNPYYAKAEQIQERYPRSSNASLCTGLDFSDLPAVPNLEALSVHPENINKNIPSDAELASYLNSGLPVVVGGVTLYELQALPQASAMRRRKTVPALADQFE